MRATLNMQIARLSVTLRNILAGNRKTEEKTQIADLERAKGKSLGLEVKKQFTHLEGLLARGQSFFLACIKRKQKTHTTAAFKQP
uniref:Uncharacterized protein n=1 Tax=Picea glauca TaxID=3330 RepID=A0A101LXV4_PICGL|nr:hypothetical protein ABT39_MTgene6194 [Picea glauca]QHR88715.1 hypothetical protein Q903MT_gene2729 [Picea sitchensis]